jgi:hypothetical protein
MIASGDATTLCSASSLAVEVILAIKTSPIGTSGKITRNKVSSGRSSEDVPSLLANKEAALPLCRRYIASQLHL